MQVAMSGIKRKIEDNDPDYEDILLSQNSKRNKVEEHNGKLVCYVTPVLHVVTYRTPVFPRLVGLYYICVFQPEKLQYGRLKPS